MSGKLKGRGAALGFAVLLVGALQFAAHAEVRSSVGRHAAGSVWDSVFTSAQATRGESSYAATCANCHGTALQGGVTDLGDSPALVGPPFLASWDGQTLGDLYDRIFSSMPADKPKTLDKQLIVDVMAHILSKNQFPAGSKDLAPDPDRLKDIKFLSTKPAPPAPPPPAF